MYTYLFLMICNIHSYSIISWQDLFRGWNSRIEAPVSGGSPMHTVAGNEAEAVEVHHGTVRDKMSQERFRNMQKGSEGPTDVDLRKSGVFKSILLNLSPSCFHFVAICPYLSPSCFAPASFPGSCLGGNSGQRWQEMARDGQRWNIWNTAVFILRCPNMCWEKRFVEQQSLPRSPKLRFSDL